LPLRIAGWSSPVARQAHNLKVLGSNPSPATNFQAVFLRESGLFVGPVSFTKANKPALAESLESPLRFRIPSPAPLAGRSFAKDCHATPEGRAFLAADIDARKKLLNGILRQIHVFDLVIRGLAASPTNELAEDIILGQLALTFPRERPQRILHTLVSWARYAELFRYSAPRHVLHGLKAGVPPLQDRELKPMSASNISGS
jgi:hypothetical protein